MISSEVHLSNEQLLEVLALSKNATAIYTTHNIIIQMANDAMIAFWGKDRSVIGKPLAEAVPELQGQPFIALLQNVLATGETCSGEGVAAELLINGELQTNYFDFEYRAIKDSSGKAYCILHTAADVTERVLNRKALEKAREQEIALDKEQALNEELSRINQELQHTQASLLALNNELEERVISRTKKLSESEAMKSLAIEQAKLGTWYINAETREFVPSARLKEMYGFNHNDEMPYDVAIAQITPAFQQKVKSAVDEAIMKGEGFDLEYPVIGYHDKIVRWLRATGQLYSPESGEPAHFSGTVMDITELKADQQRKDDFISIASHELKTPITSLKASLQLLGRMKDNPSPQMLPKLIDQAQKSIDKVTSLVDDLLNATRMTKGQLQLNKSNFTIAHMLNICCNHVRMAGRHELVLQGDMDLQIYADEHRIDQVIVNLVNNAVKYAPDSKEIYLFVEREGNHAKISVKDNGPGIAPDKLPNLFGRYYRADYSGVQYSGLGLGLYICSEIVKRHGGKIGVDSTLGQGSTFWFTLPLPK